MTNTKSVLSVSDEVATSAFFRQFPEAVPGAYRLFANLVTLDAASWARHVAERVR